MTTFGEYKKQDAKVSPESPEFIWDGRKPRLATPEEAATIRATRVAKEETEAFLNPPEAAGPRVGRALARGVTETFKDVGPGEDTRKFLQENTGLFAGIPGGIATIKGVLSGTDIAIKSIIAPFNGVIEGGAQTIKEITGSDTEANRFRRDATALTEIGFLVSSAVPPVDRKSVV